MFHEWRWFALRHPRNGLPLKVSPVAQLFHWSWKTLTFCPWTSDRLCSEVDETRWIMQFLVEFPWPTAYWILKHHIHFPIHHPTISFVVLYKKTRQVSTVPFPPPPQKKQQPPFPISAAWCPLTPFRSQVSTGLDLVELSETGEWLTTEVLGKGRDPTSIQDRFEAVWCGRWFYEKRATMVGCLGFFFGGGDEKTSQFCGDYCIVNQWFNHDTDPYSTARMTHGK